MIDMMYVALPMQADRKDGIFMQRLLYIVKAHMVLDIAPLHLQYDFCHTKLVRVGSFEKGKTPARTSSSCVPLFGHKYLTKKDYTVAVSPKK